MLNFQTYSTQPQTKFCIKSMSLDIAYKSSAVMPNETNSISNNSDCKIKAKCTCDTHLCTSTYT